MALPARASAVRSVGPPGLEVVAALRVRLQAQGGDDRLGVRHAPRLGRRDPLALGHPRRQRHESGCPGGPLRRLAPLMTPRCTSCRASVGSLAADSLRVVADGASGPSTERVTSGHGVYLGRPHAPHGALMNPSAAQVQRVYLLLTLLTTLATSFIWGVNTLFLLDAGLSNTEAFAANAFFSLGHGPLRGAHRRAWPTRAAGASRSCSGAATLLASTLLYLAMWQVEAPFVGWAVASHPAGPRLHLLLGRHGGLARRCPRGPPASGATSRRSSAGARRWPARPCSTGSVLGGVVAQLTNLGVPYLLRAAMLGLALAGGLPPHARPGLQAADGT